MQPKNLQIQATKSHKMVKKISQPNPKLPKNEKEKNLNCLTKVLKPKVCITDIPNFKRLVHELTGNGSNINRATQKPEETHIIDLGDDQGQGSMEAAVSVDVSLDSSEWCNYQPCFTEDHLVETNHSNAKFMNCTDNAYLDVSSMNQQMNDLSWMFDSEELSPSFCSGYGLHIEQEVSIYDYGYSG